MKITIVQAEIEQAIIDFIKNQVDVKDGMEINIDLRATRGAEGYQADIDIRPKAATAPSRERAPQSAKPKTEPADDKLTGSDAEEANKGSSGKPLGITEAVDNAKPARAPRTPKANPPAQTLAQSDPSDVVVSDVIVEKAQEPAVNENAGHAAVTSIFSSREAPAGDDASNDDAMAVTVTAAPKSIFGGLTKPVN